ncbi:hypothetical protein ACQ4LE_010809 [Meloidogyne hapla]|uniref:LIM zinc-binding domain-containing protein n=1 Tax=Meloidogyne hapla TaxID=6305 RepID=A0A1I8C0Q0_MELHA
MQNTTRIVGEEGIPSQKLPSLHSEPLLHQLSFLSSQNWNENINICPEPQCFQQQEFNQFCGIVSSNFLQQNQQIYDEQNIGNHNNSILLDLHTNSLSDHYSSYNNMIDENDHYLTQQLNIQSSQQNELLLITTPTSSTTSKTTTQFPLYPPTSLNNQNFLLQQLQQSQTSIFMPSPSSPSLPLIKQFSSLECTEQTKNNFPQFLSNNISSFSSSGTNLTVSSNRKSNLVNTKKSSLTSRRLNGGIQSSRRRRRERFNNNNNLICETTQLINENNEKEKALLYQQIGILKANMIEDITKSEKVSNPPQLLNSLSPINEQKGIKEKNNIITPPICAHCNEQIQEKEMLSLRKKEKIIKIKSTKIDENKLKEENIQQFYHLKCLNCSECNEDLKSETKCFEKDNNIYCSDCYAKTMME